MRVRVVVGAAVVAATVGLVALMLSVYTLAVVCLALSLLLSLAAR